MILITQTKKELQSIMTNYVGIVRSNLRLKHALDRLAIIYRETEDLFEKSIFVHLSAIISPGLIPLKKAS